MSKRNFSFRLPLFPIHSKASKLALGVVLVSFFLNYQPVFTFPPQIKQSNASAQAQPQQIQAVTAASLPFSFQLPHPGYLSTPYSNYHPGVDIASGLGMPVHPVAAGTVTEAGYSFWGYGLNVVIDHGSGYKSLYAHLGKTYVKPGQVVNTNDSLGTVGLTGNTSGPHTHLEVIKDGKNIDPRPLLPEIRFIPQPQDFIAINQTSQTTSKITTNITTPKVTQVVSAPPISTPSTEAVSSLQQTATNLNLIKH